LHSTAQNSLDNLHSYPPIITAQMAPNGGKGDRKQMTTQVYDMLKAVPCAGRMSSMNTASPVEHCGAQRWCSGWPTESVPESGSETSYTWVPDRVLHFRSDTVSRYSCPAAGRLSRPWNNNHVIYCGIMINQIVKYTHHKLLPQTATWLLGWKLR